MANKILSGKRLQIDKANANMVIILAVAAFIAVFSLVASKALLSQRSYQSRVITEKKKALTQLKANNQAASELITSYKTFVASPENIIGGSTSGSSDRDGDNAKIILDALPSKYDFPAFATSIDKILTDRNYSVEEIIGIDDELNQSQQESTKPIEIPFETTVAGNFDVAQGFLDTLQRSIRPIQIIKLTVTSADKQLKINVSGKSYYQPQKTVKITKKVIN